MRKTILTIVASAITLSVQAGQMGWTLEQCHHNLGWETDRDGKSLYYRNGHRQLWLTFDPDGTVGAIRWLKYDSAFSEAEIQQHLREASAVSWRRVNAVPDDKGELNWVGEQNGRVIFDANEDDNGRGTWFLTITTR